MPTQTKPTTTPTTDKSPVTNVYDAEIKAMKAQIGSLDGGLERVETDLEKTRSSLDRLSKALTEALAAIGENDTALSSELSVIRGDVAAVTEAVDMIGPRLDAVEARPTAEMDALGIEVGTTVKTLSNTFKTQTEAASALFASMRKEIDRLAEESVKSRIRAEGSRKSDGELIDKVKELALRVDVIEADPGSPQHVTKVAQVVKSVRDLLSIGDPVHRSDWALGQLAAFDLVLMLLGPEVDD